MFDIEEHQRQIQENLRYWDTKPILRQVYRDFHDLIARNLCDLKGETIELGSGIGNIKEAIPHCVRTDLFPNPWIDRQENAYALSMPDDSVANLILFDVFHHLEYPMDAIAEFGRVLQKGGRLIVFDHAMSIAGWFFSRFVHHEREGFRRPYQLAAADPASINDAGYYADHANAHRIFERRFDELLASRWARIAVAKATALRWVLSGGYRGPDLASGANTKMIDMLESALGAMPQVFALRMLVVLKKK